MAHKELKYEADARKALGAGRRRRSQRSKGHARPPRPLRGPRQKFGAPTITNDGVTIAREIEVEDVFQNQGAQLRRGGRHGDQRCFAVTAPRRPTVLAQAIVRQGLKRSRRGANPLALKRGIERAVDQVVKNIETQSRRSRQGSDCAGRDDLCRRRGDRRRDRRRHRQGRQGRRGQRRGGRLRHGPRVSPRACSSTRATSRPTWSLPERMEAVSRIPTS